MRAHWLQHVPFECLGSIEGWLHKAGYEITTTRFCDSDDLPAAEDIDLLVIMGGPMSVHDEHEYPWLAAEKQCIGSVIGAGKPALGICPGAQLIAESLGGRVFPNAVKEIGWFPIEGVKPSSNSVFHFPGEIRAFHRHGETFSLPRGAVQTARSAGCENQAFQIGKKVIGLQFHLETTPESARAIVENCREELGEGEFVQSEADILSAPRERYRWINAVMENLLEYLHAGNG